MHLIQKHSIEVNCNQEALGHQIKDEIGPLFERSFYPKLGALFSEYDVQDSIWQIDRLDVLLPDLQAHNWKSEIVEKALHQIKLFLDARKPMQGGKIEDAMQIKQVKNINKKEHIQYLFLSYLENGTLETNAITNKLEIIFKELEFNDRFIEKLEQTFKNQFQYVLRWSLNVPREIKLTYLNLQNITHDLVFTKESSDEISRLNDLLEFRYWVDLFSKNNSALSMKEKMGPEIESIPNEEIEEEIKIAKTDKETHYINNAGLVLLHPFLERLFDSLDYLEKNKWKDSNTQNRAVLLLQYMTNFETEMYENELVLNKLICGMPIKNTLNTEWKITDNEKKQSKKLLNALISHWSILKKTSIGGLQESFLQRDAKIERLASGKFEMTVEQKSIDLLLDQLPWGIGMIKTPWMEDYLTCQWN